MMIVIFGSMVITNVFSEEPTQGLEQMALGKIVDIDYSSDGAYYFSMHSRFLLHPPIAVFQIMKFSILNIWIRYEH